MQDGPALGLLSFDEAAAAVLAHLQEVLPMGLWAVTRRDGDAQVFVHVRDTAYGVPAGAVLSWDASLCRRMTTGALPQVVPDVQEAPGATGAACLEDFRIGAYVGSPIRSADGRVHGSLCAYAPERLPADVERHRPLLDLLAALLGQILLAEAMAARAAEREAELRRLARTDDLTGLPNRSALADRLEHALALHGRDGTGVGLLMLDLDHFKAVNDTHGHAAGDALLVRLAREWSAVVRAGDTLARLGGDEFALVVEGSSSAAAVAERVRAVVERTRSVAGEGPAGAGVGMSAGLAHVGPGDPTPSPAELLARADAALYAAKHAGRGRLVVHGQDEQGGARQRDAAARAVSALPRPQGRSGAGERELSPR